MISYLWSILSCILAIGAISTASAQITTPECKEAYLAYQNSGKAACPALNQIQNRYCKNPILAWQGNRLPSTMAKLLGPELVGPNWTPKGANSREQYDSCIKAYTAFDEMVTKVLNDAKSCQRAGQHFYEKCPQKSNIESTPRIVDAIVDEIATCTALQQLAVDTKKRQCAEFFATQPLSSNTRTGTMGANGVPQRNAWGGPNVATRVQQYQGVPSQGGQGQPQSPYNNRLRGAQATARGGQGQGQGQRRLNP